MKKSIFLMLCLGLCGCATTAKYEAKLDTWIGASEDALVASWGVPDKTYNLNNGKKAIEFIHKNILETGGYTYTTPQRTYHSGKIGDETYSGTSTTYVRETEPVRKHRLYCATSFIINSNGSVESWRHEGNNCVSQ
ncbi:MAG: hypothetical protein KBA46_03505 [Candidatus Omnitrophica bacterium]|nr:hypothetical protein [Candidatus Omnitrophota bacterium]